MFKAKHWGVAVAIILSAVGAMASNFRVADQVYLPAAGHVAGFVSDVFISNLNNENVDVTILYGPQGSGAYESDPTWKFTLLPNERREILDIFTAPKGQGGLGKTSGFGQLVFNGCKAGADCTPNLDTGENPNFRNISVESRIYFAPANCSDKYNSAVCGTGSPVVTTGQLFAGVPWYNFVSSNSSLAGLNTVFVTGFRQNASFRGNLGLVNGSQYSTTTLQAKLRDGRTGAQIGTDFNVTLGPLNMVQPSLTSAFPALAGLNTTNIYVEVTQGGSTPTADAVANGCNDGCPAFLAYGSVVDNLSTDATTLESQFTKSLNTVQVQAIFDPGTVNCTLKTGIKPLHRAVRH